MYVLFAVQYTRVLAHPGALLHYTVLNHNEETDKGMCVNFHSHMYVHLLCICYTQRFTCTCIYV